MKTHQRWAHGWLALGVLTIGAAGGATGCGQGPGAPESTDESVGNLGVAAEAFPGERSDALSAQLKIAGQTRLASYEALHNSVIVEGDMVIGKVDPSIPDAVESDESAVPPDDLLADEAAFTAASPPGTSSSELVTDTNAAFWPRAAVYYSVDKNLPEEGRVWSAMKHWHKHTKIHFIRRNGQKDFVRITMGPGCSSNVGVVGGKQHVWLGSGCGTSAVIHELGHTIGLEHEQARLDRDNYVVIHWENIQKGYADQFAKDATAKDVGAYDVHSIMHYPWWGFSKNGKPTITLKNGQNAPDNTVLSAKDIAGVATLYP